MTLMIHGKVNPLPVVQGGVLLQMETIDLKILEGEIFHLRELRLPQ
jgi:hypothetical protein